MKLQELAAMPQTKQAAKVFENYFEQPMSFDVMSAAQAQHMLKRVRSLLKEHRSTPAFHRSEKNPAYLKLVVMEQALTARIAEADEAAPITANPADAAKQKAAMAAQVQQKKRQIQDAIRAKQQEIAALQKQMNDPTMAAMAESRPSLRQRLKESEVQQAQVVLASKDMVDQVQDMIEEATSMQFKDLPALVDQIRNEIGYEQATQFNADATAALGGLVQNLQGTKQQLEAALGVVTGQAPQIPGQDAVGGLPAAPAPGEEELDLSLDANLPAEEPEDEEVGSKDSLGRGRR